MDKSRSDFCLSVFMSPSLSLSHTHTHLNKEILKCLVMEQVLLTY